MYVFVDHLDRASPHVTDRQGRPLAQNPFRDLRVRQAVNHAINREAIVSRVMDGAAEADRAVDAARLVRLDRPPCRRRPTTRSARAPC